MYLRRMVKSVPVTLATTAVAVMIATPALAAPHGISGTCYQNGAIYVSQTVRFMTATTYISASFSSLPRNGLVFGTQTQSGTFLGQNTWSNSEIGITRNVSNRRYGRGQGFVNFFRLASACPQGGCSPYNFVGSENY